MIQNLCFGCLIAWGVLVLAGCSTGNHYTKTANGVVVSLRENSGNTRLVRLQCIDDHIIRVTASPVDSFSTTPSLMVLPETGLKAHWTLTEKDSELILATPVLRACVSLRDGRVRFTDTADHVLLAEKAKGRFFHRDTVEGKTAYRIRQEFDNVNRDARYGLGENQLGLTNIRGRDIVLVQHNSEAFVPFFVSSGHYGILWDNNSITRFGDPKPYLPLDSLEVFNKDGQPGGLTALYNANRTGGGGPISRQEKDIEYANLADLQHIPPGFRMDAPASVDWEGAISSPYSGDHTFRLYSGGYIKVWIDDSLRVDRWRQSWNPVETLLDVAMEKGRKYSIRIHWIPDGTQSFLSLHWKKPLPSDQEKNISLASEMGQSIDYYFITGKNIDSVIGGYRDLTGKAPMMPLWAYGFWQSREHYASQKEILSVAAKFREKHIPIDNIVQDWFYWEKDKWGSQQFDSTRYPDPRGMIDSLHHQYHMHFMISVWPKFYTGAPQFKEFWDKGWLYKKNVEDSVKDWVGYVSTFYDAFNPEARHAFWDLVNKNLFNLGVDAWWLDASEPDILSNTSIATKKKLMDPTALGPSTEYFNAYPLVNEEIFYKGQRKASPDQRVFILTRSAFGGSQRYAAATWSGDIGSTWQDMRNQIATGISFSLSGIPYWTMDIGGFAPESRYVHPKPADAKEWREQMTRWYQFGAFCPLFRAHGEPPFREVFNTAPQGSPTYSSILYYDRLRYRMMPYIYSLAGAVYLHGYTPMRGLVMDFPSDSLARNLTDEYLFGPSLLVSPVSRYGAVSRDVYLPAGTGWYNLYGGQYFPGGQTIRADAPYSRIPVFVKAGAILPFGPSLEYTGQKPADTITLFVYTGKDGHFSLYEDEGLNYHYEQGAYSVIPMVYRESDHTLLIGKKQGSFSGMLHHRVFRVKWIGPDKAGGLDEHTAADTSVSYQGDEVTLKEP